MRVSAPHEMQQQLSHESPARQVCTCSHTEKLAAQKQLCAVLDASSAKLFLCCQFFCMQARGQICVRQIRRRLPCHGHAMGEARKNDAMEGLLCVPLTGNVCGSTATRAMPSSSFTMSPPSTRDVTHEGARDRTRSPGARREARLADDHAHEMNINSLILSWVGRRMNK